MLLDRRVVDLQSLFELSRTISSSSDLKKILDTLLLTPMGRMLITRGAILLHTGKNLFKVYTIKGLPQQLIGRVIAVEQPLNEILHIDKQGDRSKLRFFVEHRLHLICPIRHDEKCLGLLVLGEKIDQQPFGQDELAYLDAMANLAAPVVNNQRYLNELKEVNRQLDKKNQELKTLFEIGTELNSTLDKNIIANTLAYAVMGEMMVQHCVVFLQNV
ncbi:MAG: GAF domain-containing protein, partial [Calditrichaeota bacterium]